MVNKPKKKKVSIAIGILVVIVLSRTVAELSITIFAAAKTSLDDLNALALLDTDPAVWGTKENNQWSAGNTLCDEILGYAGSLNETPSTTGIESATTALNALL